MNESCLNTADLRLLAVMAGQGRAHYPAKDRQSLISAPALALDSCLLCFGSTGSGDAAFIFFDVDNYLKAAKRDKQHSHNTVISCDQKLKNHEMVNSLGMRTIIHIVCFGVIWVYCGVEGFLRARSYLASSSSVHISSSTPDGSALRCTMAGRR